MPLLAPGTSTADGIMGSVEVLNQTGTNKTTDATGLSTESRSGGYLQRYNLSFDNSLYPFVNLRAGMRFDTGTTDSEIDGSKSRSTTRNTMPSVALVLSNPFVSSGVSYDKREAMQASSGTSMTNIRENKNAFLNFIPEGLPTLEMQFMRSNTYDKERVSSDTVDNRASLRSIYRPVRNVDLSYQASNEDVENRINSSDSISLVQSARAGYNDRFFNNKVDLSANYVISRQDVKTTQSGGAGVRYQLFPVAGLSGINDTPLLGVLDTNLPLIDGNLAASSGMNIGSLPSSGGDTRKRNVGLDFGLPTEVSTLFVYVDRALSSGIAGSFAWDIYISPDNQNWSLYQTVFPAGFGQFDNRFELSFPGVTTRYIKVVTRPLSVAIAVPLGQDVTNIFITELQAFLDKSSAEVVGTSSQKSDAIDLSSRVNIIRSDSHSLVYDVYFQHRNNQQAAQSSSSGILTNALIATRRFSNVLTGSAKVMRENDQNADGSGANYNVYDASLMAAGNSLPKLNHNLVLSARRQEGDGTARDSETLFLNNAAEVYRGINVTLSGGENLSTSETGTHTASTMISSGVEIIPHRALTISLNFDRAMSKRSGGDTTFRQSSGASVSYNPFTNLYLVGSVTTLDQTGQQRDTIHNFGVSWSLQQSGGALWLNFAYNENISPDDRTRTRTLGPAMRWTINSKAFLDASYLITTNESPSATSEGKYFNTSLRLLL